MKEKQHLIGIDVSRALAAYAVILVHSGDYTWGIPVDEGVPTFRAFFYFAVPFFLAVSFFFMSRRYGTADTLIKAGFWKSKFNRV